MLSIASVTSGAGAAAYYASDNYYTDGQLTEHSAWHGTSAEALGLSGTVDRDMFEAVLAGRLPGDIHIADGSRGQHRAGFDLTFSAPKSVSLLAYVGGDRRLLDAHLGAVKEALNWAETRLVHTRRGDGRGGQALLPADGLVIALFQHDTSRALDPQAHVHAILANATRTPDGQWRALAAHALWTGKTAIASVYNAAFRQAVERLGYQTEATGRHGQFEIAGVSRDAIAAFSQRRAEIVEAAASLDRQTPAAMAAVTLRTRGAKPADIDRDELRRAWRARAAAIGFQAGPMIAAARQRSARGAHGWERLVAGVRGVAAQARMLVERLGLADPAYPADPLVPERPGRLSPPQYAAAHAVAAGARNLGEREAGYGRLDLVKAALDLGPPVGVHGIEARIDTLVAKGLLLESPDGRMLTTRQAVDLERGFLAEVDAGRSKVGPLLAKDGRPDARLRDGAEHQARTALAGEAAKADLKLTRGQLQAGIAILASSDRTLAIQGDAGAGKSAMLRPVAALAADAGRPVLGLAVSHAVANRLAEDVGIRTQTVARFLHQQRGLADGRGEKARSHPLAGAVLIVDEASMLSTADARALVAVANAAGVARLVLVGDRQQLGAVEAGRPFADLQRSQATPALRQNLRARNDVVRLVHRHAQDHDLRQLGRVLAERTITTDQTAQAASARWMALGPDERARTALFVTGRALRAAVNSAVQAARAEAGETAPGIRLHGVLSEVHLTREEQRHAAAYRPGQVMLLARPLAAQGLPAGRIEIIARMDTGTFRVKMEDGREGRFNPARLAANRVAGAVRLFDQRELAIRIGDPVLFRANDPARAVHNSDRAVLAQATPDAITFIRANGEPLRLAPTDPLLARLDLAYALNAHAAQGATADASLIVARSDEGRLITPPLLAVLLTRARDNVQLITDNLDKLLGTASRQTGEKVSAIETVRASDDKASRDQPAPPTMPKPERTDSEPNIPERHRSRDFGL
jgi:conjugative relaxase-like TrwC/TraI family protein